MSGIKVQNFVSVLRPLRTPSVIHPERRTNVVVVVRWTDKAGANGCLDLRRRAFPLGGQLSAEWSRYPGSMAGCAIDGAAPLRRSSGD